MIYCLNLYIRGKEGGHGSMANIRVKIHPGLQTVSAGFLGEYVCRGKHKCLVQRRVN